MSASITLKSVQDFGKVRVLFCGDTDPFSKIPEYKYERVANDPYLQNVKKSLERYEVFYR